MNLSTVKKDGLPSLKVDPPPQASGRGRALILCLAICSCAAEPTIRLQHDEDFGETGGRVWVRGPWESIQPAGDIDVVIDQLCPAVMKLERARDGDNGLEYCGLLYTLPDGRFYASVPSPIPLSEHRRRGPVKSCRMPSSIRDERGPIEVLADYHGHPWYNSTLSFGDMRSGNQRYSIRIQFQTTCRVLKLVPHRDEPTPGEVYLRTGRTWRLVAIIPNDAKGKGEPLPSLEEP